MSAVSDYIIPKRIAAFRQKEDLQVKNNSNKNNSK